MAIEFNCENLLKDNQRWYAIKAKRKKISIIRIVAANRSSMKVRLDLGATQLIANGKVLTPEKPEVVIRKLSEFTWDFLLFAITDLLSFVALMEFFVFLCGPFYNRRLKRQLALLSDAEFTILPGEIKTALVAFRAIKGPPEQLTLPYCNDQGDEEHLQFDFIE